MMNPKCLRGARAAFTFAFAIAGAAAANAKSDVAAGPSDADRRWIPSGSLFSMGNVEKRDAQMSADTSVRQGQGDLDSDGQSIGLPWSFGGTLDLTSPVLFDAPGRPRFFAHADFGYTYDLEDPVNTIGDPGSTPVLPPSQSSASAIQNIGASVRAEGKPLTFAGGFGPVFEFEAFERGFRFRPTLEWMYRRDTMKVALGGGESEAPPPSQVCNPDCRYVFIRSQTEKGYHSLGPGFELEADVGRAGDFLVGFYGSFRALYLVGDRKANLRSRGEWQTFGGGPTTRPDTQYVTEYERDPWLYRFGAGLRIYWLPEE